jgi:hypothetical protein
MHESVLRETGPNICKHIPHIVRSGTIEFKRKWGSFEEYMTLIEIRTIIQIALFHRMDAGFPNETEQVIKT